MTDDNSVETIIEKNWFYAVKCYHEGDFRSAISFLVSDLAAKFGLDEDDVRDFRRAVQSFDTKWQAAAKAYVQGKYSTRKQFVSSGTFLNLGFSPCREHAEVLRYALKFYREERNYRHNANSSEVTVAGRYGGCAKPMYASTKVRTPHKVVGFDDGVVHDNDGVPILVDLHDDSSAESISRLSGDNSVAFSLHNSGENTIDGHDYIQTLLYELSGDRSNKNPMDTMIFFLFAVIPLVVFSQLRAAVAVILPLDSRKPNEPCDEDPTDIEAAWRRLRANALMIEEEMR